MQLMCTLQLVPFSAAPPLKRDFDQRVSPSNLASTLEKQFFLDSVVNASGQPLRIGNLLPIHAARLACTPLVNVHGSAAAAFSVLSAAAAC